MQEGGGAEPARRSASDRPLPGGDAGGALLAARMDVTAVFESFVGRIAQSLDKRIAAGPIVTIHTAGNMQNTSGKTIFTPVLAAASSARWRRFVRSVSEYTRSDCATLVPNRASAWREAGTS